MACFNILFLRALDATAFTERGIIFNFFYRVITGFFDNNVSLLFYLRRNKRFTKSWFGFATTPSMRSDLLRFFDFLVRMWRLNERWKVISPVPVTLNLFLALEFVFTFGIYNNLFDYTLLAFHHRVETCEALRENGPQS